MNYTIMGKGKRIFALLLTVLVFLTVLPGHKAVASSSDTLQVRVKLSVGTVTSLTISVTGTYTIAENGASFTGGKLTVSASSSQVTIKHSKQGTLYTGGTATICRRDQSRYSSERLSATVADTTRTYLGDMKVKVESGKLVLINIVPLSQYLYGVVGHEMSNAFPVEALKAQAIAAKNYVLARVGTSASYDIGDTSSDQVYKGYHASYTNVIRAVDETMDRVLLYDGVLMPCYFAASNGGYMVKPSTAWGGSRIYDGGYSEGPDDYDMKNPQSPREEWLIPADFRQETVASTVLYEMVMDGVQKAVAKEGSIPEGYLFDQLAGIDYVISTDAKGNTSGVNHDRIVVTALIDTILEQQALPAEEPSVKDEPVPEEMTEEAEEGQEEVSSGEIPEQEAEEEEQQKEMPSTTEEQDVPEQEQIENLAAEPEQSVEEAVELVTTPMQPDHVSLADVKPQQKRVQVQFTILFDDLAKAGLFTKTNLRIYYALPEANGFLLRHARYGHAIGLSQRGAQQMANEGKTYQEIIAYYYGGATLSGYRYTFPEGEIVQADAEPTVMTGCGRVTGSAVKLYATASSTARVVDTLSNNTLVTIYGLKGDYYAVMVDGKEEAGYLSCKSVVLTGYAALAQGTVNGAGVNIRNGAGTGNTSLGKLEKGTEVTVFGLTDGWYRVQVHGEGTIGYIIKRYVTLQGAGASLPALATATPVVEVTPTPAVVPTVTPTPGMMPLPTPTVTPAPVEVLGPVSSSEQGQQMEIQPGSTPTPTPEMPEPQPTEEPREENAQPAYMAYGMLNYANVNFRIGPSTRATSFGKLPKGEAMAIYEKTGSWYRVHVYSLNRDGYVYAKYVKLTVNPDQTETSVEGSTTAGGVNLRKGPGTKFGSLGKLKKGTAITILGSEDGWYHVSVDSTMKVGYILANYVAFGNPSAIGETVQTTKGVVSTGLMNVRSKPSVDKTSKVMLTLRYGYTVTVLSVTDDWAYVSYNGIKGYCPTHNISMKG